VPVELLLDPLLDPLLNSPLDSPLAPPSSPPEGAPELPLDREPPPPEEPERPPDPKPEAPASAAEGAELGLLAHPGAVTSTRLKATALLDDTEHKTLMGIFVAVGG
jgi:hypothetical protein